MKKLTGVLVPYDFSESAKHALEYTVDFIGRNEVKVNIVHMPEEKNLEEVEKAYEKLNDTYAKRLKFPISLTFGEGKPLTKAILEARKKEDSEMIIMGTSGIPKEGDTTNTSQIVEKANCPVLVVPESSNKERINNISLVLGKNEIDKPKALHTLLEMCRRTNAKVHVLTVQTTPETIGYSQSDEKNEDIIMYYLENFYADHTFIENKDILEGIFSYVDAHDIDMIAILPRHHAKNASPSEGLLTKELVMKSTVPVLTLE